MVHLKQADFASDYIHPSVIGHQSVTYWGWLRSSTDAGVCPSNLKNCRGRPSVLVSRCRWGCLDIFRSPIIPLFFLPLSGR